METRKNGNTERLAMPLPGLKRPTIRVPRRIKTIRDVQRWVKEDGPEENEAAYRDATAHRRNQ